MAEFLMVVMVVAVSIGGLVLMRRSMSGASKVGKRFARHQETPIGDAIVGVTTRIAGTARPAGTSPVSEVSSREWVARDLRLRTYDGDSSPSRPAQQTVDFLVDDGSGTVLVRGADVVVTIERDFESPQMPLTDAPWADRLLRSGGYSNGSPSTCRLVVHEGVIAPGDRVEAVGRVEPADPDSRRMGARVVLRATKGEPVVLRPASEQSI